MTKKDEALANKTIFDKIKKYERLNAADEQRIIQMEWTMLGVFLNAPSIDKLHMIQKNIQQMLHVSCRLFFDAIILRYNKCKEIPEALSDFKDMIQHATIDEICSIFSLETSFEKVVFAKTCILRVLNDIKSSYKSCSSEVKDRVDNKFDIYVRGIASTYAKYRLCLQMEKLQLAIDSPIFLEKTSQIGIEISNELRDMQYISGNITYANESITDILLNKKYYDGGKLTCQEQLEKNYSKFLSGQSQFSAHQHISTGYFQLDSYIRLLPSTFTTIAARTGMGKTAFLLNLARNLVYSQHTHKNVLELPAKTVVLIFSLEMSAEQLMYRLLSMETEIPLSQIIYSQITNNGFTKVFDEIINISKKTSKLCDIYINCIANSIQKIEEYTAFFVENMKKMYEHTHTLSIFVMLDYIQLVTGAASSSQDNRTVEIGHLSRRLKMMAMTHYIAVISLAQLSRQAEGQSNILLSHIREGGSIEQDSDIVITLAKSAEFYKDENKKARSSSGDVILTVAKNRQGEVGMVATYFDAKIMKFTEQEDKMVVCSNESNPRSNLEPKYDRWDKLYKKSTKLEEY